MLGWELQLGLKPPLLLLLLLQLQLHLLMCWGLVLAGCAACRCPDWWLRAHCPLVWTLMLDCLTSACQQPHALLHWRTAGTPARTNTKKGHSKVHSTAQQSIPRSNRCPKLRVSSRYLRDAPPPTEPCAGSNGQSAQCRPTV